MRTFNRNFHERLVGGRADGMVPSQFEPASLIRGTHHEMEHTSEPETAMEIAMDHLVEHPDYYEVLEAAEMQMTPNVAGAVISTGRVLMAEAPELAVALRTAAPEVAAVARGVIPRMAAIIIRTGKWLKQGLSESQVVRKLVDSGIPKRAAVAFKDAAKDFLAGELQNAAQHVASTLLDSRTRKPRERVERTQKMAPNRAEPYYVWVVDGNMNPVEGPFGPHPYLAAKHFARIGATHGDHARAVSFGLDPESSRFEIRRIYQAGTGERLK